MKKFLGALFGLVLSVCGVQAQTTETFLALNGTFVNPFLVAHTWTQLQTFNGGIAVTGTLTQPLTQFHVFQGGVSNTATDVAFSTAIDAAIGSTRGSVLERGVSNWGIITPGTSGLPWVSNGAGADPAYQALTTPNVNFTQSGTGAVQRTLDAKLKDTVNIRDFGAVCDGSTDDTTAIQNAWNYAASIGVNFNLDGPGGTGTCVITQISAPQPTSGQTGNRSVPVGAGSGSTVFKSNVTGTNCAVTFAPNTYGTNSDYNDHPRGFKVLQSGAVGGNGICLTNVTRMGLDDIAAQGFTVGLAGANSIRITLYNPVMLGNTIGIKGDSGANTRPNDWTIIHPQLSTNTQTGMIFANPADLRVEGCDCEGIGLSNSNAAAIYINGNPIDGTKGLTLVGGYFSDNGNGTGLADIFIDNASGSQNGVHTIIGAEFQRISNVNFVPNNIFLNNNGSGTTTVLVQGNGFQGFGTYAVNAARPYIGILTPASTNYVFQTGGNFFSSATETPSGQWFHETGFATYTPTLSCGAGTLTSASATGRFKRSAVKKIDLQATATITTNGTCATNLQFSLPVGTGAAIYLLPEQDFSTGAVGMCTSTIGGSTIQCTSLTGTYPFANGALPKVSGFIELQ